MSAVEQAIIELVVEGANAFDSTNEKIQADLTSTERAGRSAEEANKAAAASAKAAEQAAKKLTAQITIALARASAGVGVAQRIASVLGADRDSTAGQALDALQSGVSGAAQGASFGKVLGPEGVAVGAVLGGLLGVAQSLQETEKRLSEQALKGSAPQGGGNEITDALLRDAGLAKLDHAVDRAGRQVQ